MDNPYPQVRLSNERRQELSSNAPLEDKIFEAIRDIRDPEHPYSLEQLSVVDPHSIVVVHGSKGNRLKGLVKIEFTPTVPHCSLASLIGLCILARIRDENLLPLGYKLDIKVCDNTHESDEEITKQLRDKERVFAALENSKLRQLIDDCLSTCKPLHKDDDVVS
ncbi:MIP18 family protein FAM96A [Galdieria sulphuraria]|nr:MIP18 family protein FAM96A [Galdieria sulphuraria]